MSHFDLDKMRHWLDGAKFDTWYPLEGILSDSAKTSLKEILQEPKYYCAEFNSDYTKIRKHNIENYQVCETITDGFYSK